MARTKRSCIGVSLLVGVLLMVPRILWAEVFADIGVGGAITQNADITTESGGKQTEGRVHFADSVTAGARIGYWFEGEPMVGVAGTVSYFQPGASGSTAKTEVVPLSLLAMGRWPLLVSKEFPKGQLQPYLGVGPGFFITHASTPGFSDTSKEAGLDFRTGAQWLFTPRVGSFVEYRLTHVGTTFRDQGVREETSLTTHHFLIGMAYHFEKAAPPPPPPPPPPPVAQAPPPPPPTKEKIVLRAVHFDFDKADIRPDAQPILDEATRILKERGDIHVVVAGHTDSRGSDAYNIELSKRRAEAVMRYLVDHGIAASRITGQGFGERQPVASNDTAEGRAENRRVELHVK
jgi:outer membrane protein OmpA-like peptidoglycan-associated protein